jgi:hypothetical protein
MRISILRLLQFFFQETLFAIQAFSERKLEKFDAQVGENLCQIRAYQIYLLAEHEEYSIKEASMASDKLGIELALATCRKLIHFYENLSVNGLKEEKKPYYFHLPLKNFLWESELLLTFSGEVFFLFQAHFLARFSKLDENNIPQTIDFSRLMQHMNCSKHLAKRSIHFMQKSLAQISSNFIFNLLAPLHLSNIKDILLNLYKIADEGRLVLPCYESAKLLLTHMIQQDCLIWMVAKNLLNNENHMMLFKPDAAKKQYEICTENVTNYANAVCVVIEGVTSHIPLTASSLTSYLKKVGVEHILLANMAAHPQYTGKVLFHFKDNPYQSLLAEVRASPERFSFSFDNIKVRETELKKMQEEAVVGGFCLANMSGLLIKHIYCSTVLAELKKLKLPVKLEIIPA